MNVNSRRNTNQHNAARMSSLPYASHVPSRAGGRSAMDKLKSVAQFTIAVLVAAVPISFYFVQPDNMQQAVASNNEVNLTKVFAAIGDSIKQKANSVFGGESADSRLLSSAENSGLNSAGAKPMQLAKAPSDSEPGALNDTALEHASKHADKNYVCPMHPDVMTNDPNAICPICGMDLVLLEAGGESGAVNLTPTVINTLGVRTEKAKRRTLYRRIDSVGYVELDEAKMRTINLRTDGWIEKLHVKSEGDRVTKGQALFELYSPKLVNAQEEYAQALRHDNQLMLKASKERLRSLGVSSRQITQLKSESDVKQLITFYSPQNGIISKLGVREGAYVKPAQTVVEIVDLNTVWVVAEIFESQSGWVKKGQRVEATLPYINNKTWEGTVDYVYPSLNAKTRSLKVRLQFDNEDESLKPNMYADVTVFAKPKRNVVTIPREALIITGDQNRVIVAMGEGRFVPMRVQVGMQTDKRVEILNGLGEGDEVVTSSQFLIDSESSLKASLARMLGGS